MAGLEDLRVIHDMPACVDGATFDWPRSSSTRPRRPATPSRSRSRTPPARSPRADAPRDAAAHGRRDPRRPGHPALGPRRSDRGRLESHASRRRCRSSTTSCAAGPARATGSNRRKASRSSRQPPSRAWPTGPRTTCEVAAVGPNGPGAVDARGQLDHAVRPPVGPGQADRRGAERRGRGPGPGRRLSRRGQLPRRMLRRQRGDVAGRRPRYRRPARRPRSAGSRTASTTAAGRSPRTRPG